MAADRAGAPFAHIGCVIEGSGHAAALTSAVALWRSGGGELSLARVAPVPPDGDAVDLQAALRRDDPNAAVRALLRDAARGVPGTVPVLIQGAPGPATCAWAEGAGVDLIVLGTGVRAGDAVDDLGEYLLAHAPCPVLVVRPPSAAPEDPAPLESSGRRPTLAGSSFDT